MRKDPKPATTSGVMFGGLGSSDGWAQSGLVLVQFVATDNSRPSRKPLLIC